ncbi:hypothetical protein BKA66DRAFT_611166 [Pyrenochaeta sp. MPI-SDFR-AT-0127]|nr:hypothetical protein BKA66DRAFT_611166 [Pyrenochaeta sp. MPI-SDFR-AT-0127]
MSDEPETPARPRASRFREHTNTNSTIRPPPDELWKDIGIEQLIEQFNEENKAPPVLRRNVSNDSAVSNGSGASSAAAAPTLFKVSSEARAPGKREAKSVAVAVAPGAPAASEGPFGRFQRAFASVFGGVLGKRKAGNVDAEKDKSKQILDERKKAANAAYHEAKELGLLPTPKVFIRPSLAAKSHKCVADGTTPIRSPRTPTLYRTPSKKDLNKQKKLSKRVSDLEFKLASARKELQSVLHDGTVPPVPALPVVLPPTPTTSLSENETSPQEHTTTPAPEKHVGKITKKRKATTIDDSDYKPIPTDSDGDISMSAASEPEIERTIKRVKSSATRKNLKRQSTRLQKKLSRSSMNKDDEVVTVVPDGVSVPPIPAIPKNVKGKKVDVGDDGYGGLEHEMF